jgi:hypothetical protein
LNLQDINRKSFHGAQPAEHAVGLTPHLPRFRRQAELNRKLSSDSVMAIENGI